MEPVFEEGRISREIFDSYEDIKNTFRDYKNYFESAGLQEFGPERLSYIELLDFTYRVSKIIEFYYLRNMKYELLQNLRNDILFYVEKEIFAMKG